MLLVGYLKRKEVTNRYFTHLQVLKEYTDRVRC